MTQITDRVSIAFILWEDKAKQSSSSLNAVGSGQAEQITAARVRLARYPVESSHRLSTDCAGAVMDVFQTFPLHPQPAPLESFSSYLLRLSAANRIQTAGRLFRLIFPQDKRNTDSICDLGHASFGILPEVAACPESLLLQTTFHYLLTRFLRQKPASVLRTFLGSTLSDDLRFCPQCVDETGYYQLVWRFRLLPGCVRHCCYLLDACPSCGGKLPVFATPLRLGRCPKCASYLAAGVSPTLTTEDEEQTQMRWHDFTFLLAPWQQHGQVRPRLTQARQQVGVSLAQISRALSLRQSQVKGMEAQATRPVPALEHFVNYLDVLGWSFHDLFELPSPIPHWRELVQRVTSRRREALLQAAQQRETNLLNQAQAIVTDCLTAGKSVTIQTLAAVLVMSSADVKSYPALVSLLAEQRQYRRNQFLAQREAEFLARIELLLSHKQQQRLTRLGLSQELGIDRATLRVYPQVRALLDKAVRQSQNPDSK